VLEWRLTFSRVDVFFGWLYHWGGRFIFTKPGQIVLGLISLCGLIAYFMVSDGVQPIVKDPVRSLYLLVFLIPATFVSLLLHEIAHGLTTKHYDRKIRGAGIGWYWFGPIAFVDTTDMWTTSRWSRIAVSLAGPYTFLLLASIASLVALLSESQIIAASLWQFAMVSYFNVARNLNPLFEYDGYFVLSDFLDKPNLRQQCLGWIGQHLWENLGKPAVLREHLWDLLYGFLSIVFVGMMAFFAVSTYRAVLESILTPVLPAFLMTALPWIVASVTVASGAIAIIGDMRSSPK
jgi:putative peptide zinc metalloprotease protein